MKTVGRCTRAHDVQRLKSCQIASNYESVDAYARRKIFLVYTVTSHVGKSANRNFLSPISYHSVNHLILPWASILVSRLFSHSLPWRIFRGNANSRSPTSSLKLAIYRIDDVEGKWMYVCGKIEATPWIYLKRIFLYPPRCPRVISMMTRTWSCARDNENSSLIRWKSKTRLKRNFNYGTSGRSVVQI